MSEYWDARLIWVKFVVYRKNREIILEFLTITFYFFYDDNDMVGIHDVNELIWRHSVSKVTVSTLRWHSTTVFP